MKSAAFFFLLASLQIHAQKRDLILNYEEDFQGGTIVKWQYQGQFSIVSERGSAYGAIKAPYNTNSYFELPFPAQENANNNLGKDFSMSCNMGNLEPRIPSDTSVYFGYRISLSWGYEISFAVNGLNNYRISGGSDSCAPFFLEGRYAGPKPWGDYSFSTLMVSKKKDSLIFTLNDKQVLKTRMYSERRSGPPPSEYCYSKSVFACFNIDNKKLINPPSYVIDMYHLTWYSRPGDEIYAEQLLNDKLAKYDYFSAPYFGKYIVAKSEDGKVCVLNRYGNYIIPPTDEDIQITTSSGIFTKEDGGRTDFYDSTGGWHEDFGPQTSRLLKTRKYPQYLQLKPQYDPLWYNDNGKLVLAGKEIGYLQSVGVFTEKGKKGVRSRSGIVYLKPDFDSIWVEGDEDRLFAHEILSYNYLLCG